MQSAVDRLRSGRLRTRRHASPAALARLLGGLADAGAQRQRLERVAAYHLAGGAGGAAADPILKVSCCRHFLGGTWRKHACLLACIEMTACTVTKRILRLAFPLQPTDEQVGTCQEE